MDIFSCESQMIAASYSDDNTYKWSRVRLQFKRKPDILSGSIWGHQVLITIRNWTLFPTYKYLSAVFKSFIFRSILLCLVSEGGCLEHGPRKHRPQTAEVENSDLEITSLI